MGCGLTFERDHHYRHKINIYNEYQSCASLYGIDIEDVPRLIKFLEDILLSNKGNEE